jgi:D-glucuronyl C5-epimerase C-terminus
VLNGMMFAVLAIYDYYVCTGDPAARYFFDKGVVALRNDLPFYDDNV